MTRNSPDTGDSEAGALLAITADAPCKVDTTTSARWMHRGLGGRSILEVDINCTPGAESGARREIVVRCCEGRRGVGWLWLAVGS
jgi:hypothetical protein